MFPGPGTNAATAGRKGPCLSQVRNAWEKNICEESNPEFSNYGLVVAIDYL